MRVPQISDRIKEAPAVVLRGFLAGVGQLLLITDRLRNKTGAGEEVPQARTPDASESVPASAQAAALPEAPAAEPEAPEAPAAEPAGAAATPPGAPAAPKERDFDKTGNVRLLTEEDAETPSVAPEVAEVVSTPAAEAPAAEAPAAEAPATEAPAFPLANYDELSVASLRARLRNLTAAQVTELAEYEKAHAARAEVITMFERRIAKLESGG